MIIIVLFWGIIMIDVYYKCSDVVIDLHCAVAGCTTHPLSIFAAEGRIDA